MFRGSTFVILACGASTACTNEHVAQVESALGSWTGPYNVGAPINTPYNDMYALLSEDHSTMYFTSDRPGGFGGDDIWVSHRTPGSDWSEPTNVAVLNTEFADSLPMFADNGSTLYFFSDRPGGCGAGDLWVSYQSCWGWSVPENIGCRINSPQIDNAPAFYANTWNDTDQLYFGSNRPGGVGDFDVYVTTRDHTTWKWGLPELVTEVSSTARDTRTFVRSDGREMFITSNRDGGLGALDMWVSTRLTGLDPWSTPVDVGDPISSSADDGSPWLSSDGTTMYFFSTRAGGYGARDIYFATRDP